MKPIKLLLVVLLGFSSGLQASPWIEKVYQNLGESLEAPVGAQVFKAVRRETALNAFGKADMFGRADDRGYMEVSYRGLTREGKVVLRVVEVDPKAKTSAGPKAKTGTAAPLPAGVAALTHDTAIALAGHTGKADTLPANTTEVALDLSQKHSFRFGSVVIAITGADNAKLKYSLQQVSK
jgi:hypothetical protein